MQTLIDLYGLYHFISVFIGLVTAPIYVYGLFLGIQVLEETNVKIKAGCFSN